MDEELASILDRADELLRALEAEYEDCFQAREVSLRARNLTSEVLERLKNALDQAMWRAWEKYVKPRLPEKDRKRARVYFPCAKDLQSFRSTLGRGRMLNLDKIHNDLYLFLLNQQPFASEDNQWLFLVAQIAGEKHIRLVPQTRRASKRIRVIGPGGSVSWDPSSVKFGPGVSILGAPVDPETQRVAPTPGVAEQAEVWVSFTIDSYGVNALAFCKDACQKTRALIGEMMRLL